MGEQDFTELGANDEDAFDLDIMNITSGGLKTNGVTMEEKDAELLDAPAEAVRASTKRFACFLLWKPYACCPGPACAVRNEWSVGQRRCVACK